MSGIETSRVKRHVFLVMWTNIEDDHVKHDHAERGSLPLGDVSVDGVIMGMVYTYFVLINTLPVISPFYLAWEGYSVDAMVQVVKGTPKDFSKD